MLEQAAEGLISNLGVFAPCAAIGWWVIRTQRTDLTKERDDARADLADCRKRNEELSDRVITLAQGVERTMADLAAAIRSGKPGA